MRSISCALLMILCCALPLASGSAQAQTAGYVEAWLPVPHTKYMSDTQVNALLDKAKNAGVDGVHTQAAWDHLEPSYDNDYEWAFMDRFVNKARARGLKVTMQLTAAPSWVSPEGGVVPTHGILGSRGLARLLARPGGSLRHEGGALRDVERAKPPHVLAFWARPCGVCSASEGGISGSEGSQPQREGDGWDALAQRHGIHERPI